MSQEESQYTQRTLIPLQIENVLLKGLKSSQTLLSQSVIQSIRTKVQNITGGQSIVHSVDTFIFSLINRIQQLSQAITIDINREDYENLEAAVQKAESQIRNHIRLEQQLKIYMQGLEQKIEQLERQLKCENQKYHQLFESAKSLDAEKKELKKRIKAMEFKYKPNYQKNQRDYPHRHLSHKGSKIITEPSLHHQNSSSSAFKMYQDRSKLTRAKNLHHRSGDNHKNHQPSSNKKKQLGDNIKVSLGESPKKKQSLQEYQSSKEMNQSLTKTVLMKEVQKKKSRKVIEYETQSGPRRDRKQMRSSSVCN